MELRKATKTISISALLGLGALAMSSPASASYMQTCDALIADWKSCKAKGANCSAKTSAIETQCKCHALKGNEWKLIMAAVAKNNVCGSNPEDVPPIKLPEPRHPTTGTVDPNGRGGH